MMSIGGVWQVVGIAVLVLPVIVNLVVAILFFFQEVGHCLLGSTNRRMVWCPLAHQHHCRLFLYAGSWQASVEENEKLRQGIPF